MSLREKASKVKCPACGAEPGSRCVKLSASARSWTVDARGQMAGQWRKQYHDERLDLVRETSRYCTSCCSEDLFSGFFNADDLAVTDDTAPGTRWTTFCNECGTEQK